MEKENLPSPNSIKLFIILILSTFVFISSGYAQKNNTVPMPAVTTQWLTEPSFEANMEGGDILMTPESIALTAAAADVMTTSLVLASGGVEMNPVVSTTPLGLIALAGTKIGLIKYAGTLPEPEKRIALKSVSSISMGAAFNNIAVYLAAPPPFPIVAGLIMVYATWNSMSKDYITADKLLALSLAKKRGKDDEYLKSSIANIK